MSKKILSTVFVTGLILTGCGIESIFNGGLTEWLFCFFVTAVCAIALGGYDR